MTVTWPKIQYGGRSLYWKSLTGYNSAADHPILVKFCGFSQNFGNGTDTCVSQNVISCFNKFLSAAEELT